MRLDCNCTLIVWPTAGQWPQVIQTKSIQNLDSRYTGQGLDLIVQIHITQGRTWNWLYRYTLHRAQGRAWTSQVPQPTPRDPGPGLDCITLTDRPQVIRTHSLQISRLCYWLYDCAPDTNLPFRYRCLGSVLDSLSGCDTWSRYESKWAFATDFSGHCALPGLAGQFYRPVSTTRT